jgi:hypothetical protein
MRVLTRIGAASLAVAVVAAVVGAAWYRKTYNVWPGQSASAQVRWCSRDYENFGGAPDSRQQMSAQQRLPVRLVAQYPPLALSGQQLYAAVTPQAQRDAFSPPLPCAMIVYLRTGRDSYQPYSLEGGP